MKSITKKIIATSILVLIVSSAVPNIIWVILGGTPQGRPQAIEEAGPIFLVIGLATAITSITIYSFLINRILVKRVKKVSIATKDVMKGDFDTSIEVQGKDELSQLIENFNSMTEELKNNEYLNKEFVRNFSHEMKTPLSAIKGYAELLGSNGISEQEKEDYLKIIISESTRLSSLSKNMLLISQVDSHLIIPKRDTFNLTEQIRNIIQLTQLEWEQKSLDFDLDVKEVNIVSNKEFTYQAFANLIGNAIKYSPEKSLIKMKLHDDEDYIYYQITNKGTLTKEEQNQVFNLFYIKDKSRTSKSSGVGLSLTKKIIEKLEGTIEVFSENNDIIFHLKLKK